MEAPFSRVHTESQSRVQTTQQHTPLSFFFFFFPASTFLSFEALQSKRTADSEESNRLYWTRIFRAAPAMRSRTQFLVRTLYCAPSLHSPSKISSTSSTSFLSIRIPATSLFSRLSSSQAPALFPSSVEPSPPPQAPFTNHHYFIQFLEDVQKNPEEHKLINIETQVMASINNKRLEIADWMLQEIDKVGLVSHHKLHSYLINEYTKQGTVHALSKADRLIRFLESRNLLLNSLPFLSMIHGYVQIGDFSTAEAILENLHQRNLSDPEPYNVLFRAYAAQERFKDCRRIMTMMKEHKLSPNTRTLNALLTALSKRGFAVLAERTLRNDLIPRGCEVDVVTYTILMQAYCTIGNMKEAERIFEETVQLAKQGKLKLSDYPYNVLLTGFLTCKQIQKAEQFWKRVVLWNP